MTPCPHLVARIMTVMETAFDPTYREAWNRRQVSDALSLPSTHAAVIDSDGDTIVGAALQADTRTPAGFVLTRAAAGEEELLLIAVTPELRNQGLGQILIDRLFAAAKARGTTRVFLEMRQGNPAIRLYQRVGFTPIGKRPNYYRHTDGSTVDAITFGRTI